jgi:hypothetical protein
MATAEDAKRIVTDPNNAVGNDTHSSESQVNGKKAVAALRKLGAGKAEARELISEAVRELGGRVDSEVPTGGGAGHGSRKAVNLWFIPLDAVRKPDYSSESND